MTHERKKSPPTRLRSTEPGQTRSGIAISTLAFAASKVLPGLIGLVSVPLWVRILGTGAYGAYSVLWVVVIISASVGVGWIRQANLRYTGDERLELNALPRLGVTSGVVLSSLPVIMTAILLLPANEPSLTSALLIVFALSFALANSVYTILLAEAQRKGRAIRYAIAELVRSAGALGTSLAIYALFIEQYHAAEITGALIIVSSYTASTCVSALILWQRGSPTTRKRDVLIAYWRFGWPMSVWLGLSQFMVFSDRLVISLFDGASATGTYAAISDLLVRGAGMFAMPLTMVAHPLVMNAWNSGETDRAAKINRNYTKVLWAGGIVGLIIAILCGTQIVEWILGIRLPNGYLVPLIATGAVVWQIAQIEHKHLELLNRTRLMAVLIAISASASICINLILVPLLGITGAAFTFAFTPLLYVLLVRIATHTIKRKA